MELINFDVYCGKITDKEDELLTKFHKIIFPLFTESPEIGCTRLGAEMIYTNVPEHIVKIIKLELDNIFEHGFSTIVEVCENN